MLISVPGVFCAFLLFLDAQLRAEPCFVMRTLSAPQARTLLTGHVAVCLVTMVMESRHVMVGIACYVLVARVQAWSDH